jgi:hypothetical protein
MTRVTHRSDPHHIWIFWHLKTQEQSPAKKKPHPKTEDAASGSWQRLAEAPLNWPEVISI